MLSALLSLFHVSLITVTLHILLGLVAFWVPSAFQGDGDSHHENLSSFFWAKLGFN